MFNITTLLTDLAHSSYFFLGCLLGRCSQPVDGLVELIRRSHSTHDISLYTDQRYVRNGSSSFDVFYSATSAEGQTKRN